jgi:hypothetical protein
VLLVLTVSKIQVNVVDRWEAFEGVTSGYCTHTFQEELKDYIQRMQCMSRLQNGMATFLVCCKLKAEMCTQSFVRS